MAANIFTGAINNNWGTAGNWSLVLVPTAVDGHVATFDITSPSCVVDTSNRVCNAIDFTGYTNTFTMTFALNVTNNVTLSGSMTIGGASTLTVSGTSTLTANGKTWPNALTLTTVGNKTFADAWVVGGLLQTLVSSSVNVIATTITADSFSLSNGQTWNGGTLIINNGMTIGQNTPGTTLFSLRGGAWSGGGLLNNLEINASGIITIGGTVAASNLTYITASSVITTGSTLSCVNSSATWNTAGIIWNNILLSAGIITLNSLLTATGTMTVAGANTVTFAGTSGFNVANFTSPATAARTTTFVAGVTYTVTTSITMTSATSAARHTFASSSGTVKAILTLSPGCTQDIGFCNATRIDSSLGRTVLSYKGVFTDCINWRILPVVPATLTT